MAPWIVKPIPYFLQTTSGTGGAVVETGNLELVGSAVLTGDASSISVTISPAVDMADISFLRVICNVKAADSAAEGQNNELRVNSISTSTYNTDGVRVQAGGSIIENNSGEPSWLVLQNNHNGNRFGIVDIVCNRASETLEALIHSGGQDGGMWLFGYNSTSGQTDFSDITLLANNGSNNMAADSRIDVYKCIL